jgi:integrase
MADVFRPMVNGRRSTYYYGKVRDPRTKKWKKVALEVTDKGVAREKLRELRIRTERAAYGLIDPATDLPILDHLDRLDRELEHEGATQGYRRQVFREIAKIALHCAGRPVPVRIVPDKLGEVRTQLKGITIDQLTVDAVDDFLAGLPTDSAARTRNAYRTSVVKLFSFLVKKKKLPHNPMLAVSRAHGEPKRRRRAVTKEELQRLLNAALVRPLANTLSVKRGERKGQPVAAVSERVRLDRERDGRRRALIYLTAVYTGLRRSELRALQVKYLRLDDPVPTVHLPAAFTKNGKEATIPIPAVLAGELKAWVAGLGPDDAALGVPRYDELLKAFKKDLAHAGIPYRDDRGRVFDFHSLRKCLGSYLRHAKVDPAVSRVFMRHSDIRLTMQTYDDEDLHDLHTEATAKLPAFTL